jgi:hypothetical protein
MLYAVLCAVCSVETKTKNLKKIGSMYTADSTRPSISPYPRIYSSILCVSFHILANDITLPQKAISPWNNICERRLKLEEQAEDRVILLFD